MLRPVDKGQIAQSLLLDPLNEGMNLVRRYQEGQGFKSYVQERIKLLVPIGLLMAVTSVACAAATVLYLGGTRSVLVLLAMLLVPFVLIGSAFVQAYVFVSWLENRALAKALHRGPPAAGPIAARLRKAGIDMGAMPPVPWVLAAIFLVLPLIMLASVVPKLAIALIVLQIAAPVVFARLDR
jgi:hypothetical protein